MIDDVIKNPPKVNESAEESSAIQALRESEARYRELVELANSMILRWDQHGIITFFNECAQRFFGYTEAEIIGRHVIGSIVPETDGTGRDMRPLMEDICKYPEVYTYNVNENITKSGERVWVAWTNRIIKDEQGQPIGALSVGTDITREHQLEQELRQAVKMHAIGELAGGIAHDFNNFLHAIMGYAETISYNPSLEDAQANAKRILKIAEDAGQLTSNLLTFARKTEYSNEVYDAKKVIKEVGSIIEHTFNKRIECIISFHAHSYALKGDATQLKSALLNLAINAQDAMPNGGQLSIRCAPFALDSPIQIADFTLQAGDYLHIKFLDNGIGISSTKIQRIFEPFYTSKQGGRGTGLGLAAVYGTVHRHQGAIKCASICKEEHANLVSGTAFDIYLPLSQQPFKTVPVSTATEPSVQHIHILLIDDEDMVLDFSKRLFESIGHKVSTFNQPEQAIYFYGQCQHDIDLVLLDMNMPILDGEAVFDALKALNPEVKVILSSGYGYEEKIQDLLDKGLYGFQQKPYTTQALQQAISQLKNPPR
ncbi:MAG: PAS domain S-box protein [Pseudomonadales bacterium]|nr:PAS domain S-box protein [Pseudomonadales bacterium]